jgi:hypothetical protein
MQRTRYSCQILMKLEFSQQVLKESSYIKFHENPSSGSRVVPCGQTDARTDMKKLIVAFRNFANAPKNTAL